MEVLDDARQFASAERSSIPSAQWRSLKDFTEAHSASSNDCDWLHEFVSSDAVSTGGIGPKYLLRVHYKETRDASATITEDFRPGSCALLKRCLDSKYIRAVILCHRDSSQVDPAILDLLWNEFKLEVSFMRHHFDYKEIRDESGCPEGIGNRLRKEDGLIVSSSSFGGHWNPIRLPSETRASVLRLTVDSECLSVCCRGGIVIALIRSNAIYRQPLSWGRPQAGRERYTDSCANDLFAATAGTFFMNHEFPSDSFEFSCGIVHFYARLLVLRCYEDYNLRHDTQPIVLEECNQVCSQGHPDIVAMHHRRLELVKLKQALSGYLGPLTPEHESFTFGKGSELVNDSNRGKLPSLVTDVEMLMSLYENTMRTYEWSIHETDSDYKAELASEQLAEAKESKATAISLGKLSNLAFLYLPINFVCAMLGMNLGIFGKGTVPVWVFFILVFVFGLLTYLPIYLFPSNEQRAWYHRLAYHLARRSIFAGFWFLAFTMTHDNRQNFEIINSGLAQVCLGSYIHRTKGWKDERHDGLFDKATLGSKEFWKERVKRIYVAIGELNSNDRATELTV